MIRERIKFGLVKNDEELAELREFAKSFGHEIRDDAVLPIYTGKKGDQLIGYFNLIGFPLVCPSLHPEHCTHRDFFDCVEFLKQHFCLNSISERFPYGISLLALPLDLPDHKKEAVERAGFKRMDKEIWFCVP